ncbi:MAG: hypothetical protein L0227_05305, partial [Chloroflexi bacterium]|nr:hypothetical protein [Chloroflexota bacterium]
MGANDGREPTRPAIAIALADPDRSHVDVALVEAGFDTIPLPPGASIAEAFSPNTPTLVAIVDVAGDPEGAAARVAEARRGRPGDLSVLFLA